MKFCVRLNLNRRIRNRTYGGVRGRELVAPSYSIPKYQRFTLIKSGFVFVDTVGYLRVRPVIYLIYEVGRKELKAFKYTELYLLLETQVNHVYLIYRILDKLY
jgi:hypothetical protein